MEKLKKYTLDMEQSIKYIHWNFEDGNVLCKSVLKDLPFRKGIFFSFLREGLSAEEVNQYRRGHVGGGVKEKIAKWLLEHNEQKNGLLNIFDSDDADYNKEISRELFSKFGVHYDNEVYYLLSKRDLIEKNIKDCLYESNIIWHSLCVVSKYSYKKNKDQSITKKELEQIVKNAEIILVLAYDAEGYIIWQRNID